MPVITIPDYVIQNLDERITHYVEDICEGEYAKADIEVLKRLAIDIWAEGYACATADFLLKRTQPTSTDG